MKYGAEPYKQSLSRKENKRNRRRTRSKERRIGKEQSREQK